MFNSLLTKPNRNKVRKLKSVFMHNVVKEESLVKKLTYKHRTPDVFRKKDENRGNGCSIGGRMGIIIGWMNCRSANLQD